MEAIRTAPDTHGRPDLDVSLPGWYAGARCLDADPALFFADGQGDRPTDALRVCGSCAVVDDCRAYAVADPSLCGVWGATTEKERRKLRAAGR